jgi:hypothetical protein
MKRDNDMPVNGQSIGIIKDKETATFVDYFFESDLWCKDPRFQSWAMKIGECRGLFRVDRETLGTELLFRMVGDDAGSRFDKAPSKVLKEFHITGSWPDRTQFASG